MNATAMAGLPPLKLGPKAIAREIRRCLKVGLVPNVSGSPGISKSAVNRQIANAAFLKFVDIRLGQCDVTDVNGMPHFYTDEQGNMRVMYVPFGIFPLKGDPLPPVLDEKGQPVMEDDPENPGKQRIKRYNGWYICFDEITSANKDLQAASYKIILDRKVGEYDLHDEVYMTAAGNLKSDKAVVYEMSTALQSRMVHLEMEANKDDWVDWAINEGNIDPRILAFIEFQPHKLMVFDPNHDDKTFACPRTWEFASKLTHGQKLSIVDDLPLLAGAISQRIAAEYIQFSHIFDQTPKLKDILTNPDTCDVPDEHSVCYATAIMLVDHIDQKNVADIIKYLRRFPIEALVLSVRLLCKKQPKMVLNPTIKDVMREYVNPSP